MAELVKYVYGTEAQILALTPFIDPFWFEKGFYYPSDKTYFYQAINGVMKKYGSGEDAVIAAGIGVLLNGQVIGGIKTLITETDILLIPENYDYNTFYLNIEGTINCNGQINIL